MIKLILEMIRNRGMLVTVNNFTDYLFYNLSNPGEYSVYNEYFKLEDVESITVNSESNIALITLKENKGE